MLVARHDDAVLGAAQGGQRAGQFVFGHHDGAGARGAEVAHLDGALEQARGAADQASRDAADDARALERQLAQVQRDGDQEVVLGAQQHVRGGEVGEERVVEEEGGRFGVGEGEGEEAWVRGCD